MIRHFLAAIVASLALAGCGKTGSGATSTDPYAGLETQIVSWRNHIEATHPACATKVEGKGCESYQVTCKAAQEITSDETSKGVTAQVVAAMTFSGRNPDGSTARSGSSFGLFSRAGGAWSRVDAMPVNMTTCAPA